WVNGYYVGYQNNLLAPADIDWTNLTHLSVGAVIPNADGTLDTSFYIDNTNGPLWAKQTVTLAHQNGRKAIVMLGGAATRTGWVGAMSSNRAAFEQNLLNLAKNYGFDGFDLDWEDFPTSDEPLMLALVQDLRKALPSTIITIPVGWLNANDNPLKASAIYATLAPMVDQLNIMSYGMAGPWGGWKTWHSAALGGETPSTPSSVKTSIQAYLNDGVPAAKMGIGIGFYGSCWAPGVTTPNQALGSATVVADDNVMSYRHIYESYLTPQVLQWDPAASATYLSFSSPHGAEGCTFVSYEDEKSITEKAKYVKSAGLGGAIVWTIGEGHLPSLAPGKRDPLLTALGAGLQ
ncbi:MAG TPA: glycoside hydrolase family 18 protein, partial [Polyangiaceae bacterium]